MGETEFMKMKWIEVIEVRSVNSNKEKIESQLRYLLQECSADHEIKIYTQLQLDTDIAIHLCHKSEVIYPEGSSLGQHLVANFRELGLVSHRVWVEMNH